MINIKSPEQISKETIAKYARSDSRLSTLQIINSFIPYFVLVTLMYFSLNLSYLLTLLLAIPAAGFMIRIFIIFHDCGHGSFFRSKKLNAIVGFIAGIITFVPYHHWTHKHAIHHATCSDLDRRGMGDVWTLTVKEYEALSKRDRFWYRINRNPFMMFLIGPVYMFLINNRFVNGSAKKRERRSVYWTNISIAAIVVLLSLLIGVQHQFEGVYWDRHENWDFHQAAIEGSSFFKLPKILQWFSGNIGYHHVHHLSSRIPNYHLQLCHEQIPAFRRVKPITLRSSLKSLKFRLWDEEDACLVGFDYNQTK
jgi:omega-6 fatty acid desaturase (delta-12 desaturase)